MVGLFLLGAAILPRQVRKHLCLAFAQLSRRHRVASVCGIGALLIAVRLCCLPILPRPTPLIPDEHSYLFLGRTLAAGRFANPVHPMWRHFETLFILQQPAYASVYPPAQGVILAIGLILFGEPWAGVLASMAGLSMAVVWMLRAYETRAWALYGGLLSVAGYGILSYWTNSYWGGAAAAIGGALALGALPRILSNNRRRDAAILGLGLLVLATSRPYEGFLTALPIAFYVVRHFSRAAIRDRAVLRKQAPVLACVILAGGILTCWYNWRVTGSPLRLPHAAYIQQYAAVPAFIWQRAQRAPEYRDRVLREAHLSFGIDYAEYSTFTGAAGKTLKKIARIAIFYWGPLWVLVVLTFPEFVRERRFRVAVLSLALCITGILLTVGFQVHYAAPCTSIFILMLVYASRCFCTHLRRAGAVVVIATPLAWVGSQALARQMPLLPNSMWMRPSVETRIAGERGRHLVLVHYGPLHPLGEEWVYNEPDVDHSRVIWARDLGPQANQELFRYYPERAFWLVEPDHPRPLVARCTPECTVPEDKPASPTGSAAGHSLPLGR